MPIPSVSLQAEFSGIGAGWTEIWSDVRMSVPVRFGYGIRGNGPADRVASPGVMTFALDNSKFNSGGLFGYYSPGHTNCRSGFDVGIAFRIGFSDGTLQYKFFGTLSAIQPTANVRGGPWLTYCVVMDWMDEASRTNLDNIPIQINKTATDLVGELHNNVPRPPRAVTPYVSTDVYPYSFDNSRDEGISVLEELQRLAMSEVGWIYIAGDNLTADRLFFETRSARATKNTSLTSLDNTMHDLVTSRSRDDIINRMLVQIHPRRIDAAATSVLFNLTETNAIIELGSGETKTVVAPYTDPTQRNTRVGGTDMVAPVATTDYLLNTAADGSGSNITASLVVSADFYANVAFLTLTNTNASVGYVTKLQLRGKGIYDMQHLVLKQEDASSIAQFGGQAFTYVMPYQSDPNVGDGAARYLLSLYKDQVTDVESVSFHACRSAALLTAARAREPGDRIDITETQTGLTSTTGYFIQSVDFEIGPGNITTVTWGLAPASQSVMWLLGTAGASELGVTTMLGF